MKMPHLSSWDFQHEATTRKTNEGLSQGNILLNNQKHLQEVEALEEI